MIHDDAVLEKKGEPDEACKRYELFELTNACLFEDRPSEILALSGRQLAGVAVRDISTGPEKHDCLY